MTIAICDEIRKDAQKLYRQLPLIIPDEPPSVSDQRVFLKGTGRGTRFARSDISGAGCDQGRSLETVHRQCLKGHYIPVVLVAENEKFYKEAFEVFCL